MSDPRPPHSPLQRLWNRILGRADQPGLDERRPVDAYLSMGFVIGDEAGQPLWLMERSPANGDDNFVGTLLSAGESFREALARHLSDQYRFDAARDFLISSAPHVHLEVSPPHCEGADPQRYVIHLYQILLRGKSVWGLIDEHEHLHWITSEQLRTVPSADKPSVGPLTATIVRRTEIADAHYYEE